jgi:inorganic pyrophosphatase
MEVLNYGRSLETSSSARRQEAHLPGHHRNAQGGAATNLIMIPIQGSSCWAGSYPKGMMFPFDFGFIPSTLGEDEDPLDILVLMDAPAHVGCLIDVRIIGIIQAEQTEDGKTENNERLLGVAIHSYDHVDLESIDDVSKTLLDQLEEFFISYNKQRGKKFRITGIGGPGKAIKFLKAGIKAHQKQSKSS